MPVRAGRSVRPFGPLPIRSGRAHRAEQGEQQEIVDDLQRAADHQRPAEAGCGEQRSRRATGSAAAARLRGTAVKLAAAARSAGVTTAMT